MTADEKARDLANWMFNTYRGVDIPHEDYEPEVAQERIAEALREAQRDALEAAAYHVQHYWVNNGGSMGMVNRHFIGCAGEIRELDVEDMLEEEREGS